MRTLFLAGAAIVAVMAWLTASPLSVTDADLAMLMVGMAAIKAALLLAAAAVLVWRFGQPCSRAVAASYCLGAWMAIASTVWIAQLSFIAAAAGLFHVGELLMLVTAWRDDRFTLPVGRSRPTVLRERRAPARPAAEDRDLADAA